MILRDLVSKQITHLNIDITQTTELCSEIFGKNLAALLSLCERLTALNFCDVFRTRKCWLFIFPAGPGDYVSSTLVKLKINVATFLDSLILLDVRLESLSTLFINVSTILDRRMNIDRTVSTTAHALSHIGSILVCIVSEEIAKTQVFIIHIVRFHISL